MNRTEILSLLELPLQELIARANQVRAECAGNKVELCNIMNAKSGACAEDCKFCAQSGRHSTSAAVYPLQSKAEMLKQARRAREIGAHRFDIVTSGDSLSRDEVARIAEAIAEIRSTVGIALCASLGTLGPEDFGLLASAGLSRYHHNIETSRRFFPQIVTTHSYDDRVRTVRTAKAAGLQVCSGGILGLGETMEDRVDMALELLDLNVDSVPLNVLVPIKGTSLENQTPLSPLEAVRSIAIFRIVLRHRIIKLAAGRESALKDYQALAYMAGANGMLIGCYLTIAGRSVADDRALAAEIEKMWESQG